MQKLYKRVVMSLMFLVMGSLTIAYSPFNNSVLAANGTLECAVLPSNICSKAKEGGSEGGVFALLVWVLVIMTALVGFAAVGGLIWAGILYASASANAEQVKRAKTIIRDVIIGLVAYGLMFVVLNWLIPGGVIGD